jgi:hypothetical protein
MIQIELKAKHFYLAADILLTEAEKYTRLQSYLSEGSNVGLNIFFSQPIIDNIKAVCQVAADDDLVTVETDVTPFITVFKSLAQKAEGSYNNVNTEMMDLLIPQITTGVTANDPEWISLNDQITAIRAANLEVVNNDIINAKNKLYN